MDSWQLHGESAPSEHKAETRGSNTTTAAAAAAAAAARRWTVVIAAAGDALSSACS